MDVNGKIITESLRDYLPSVLSDKAISWEWATETTEVGPLDAIRRCDFVIGILDGSKSDQHALFEQGVAAGLRSARLQHHAS